MLKERKEIIDICLGFENVYEDYPFHDDNWTVMRRRDNKRGFAWIFERNSKMWVNLKIDPLWSGVVCNTYRSVIPAYHMDKKHWISVILDGSVPDEEIISLIADSFCLCAHK